MKKSISFLMMLIVAVSMFGQSYKASQLVGKWHANVSKNNANAELVYTFNADKSGECVMTGEGKQPIGSGFLAIKMPIYMKFSWKVNENIISVKNEGVKLEITEDNIDFICDNPQEKAEFEKQKPAIVSQLNMILQSATNAVKDFEGDLTIISLSNDKLTIHDKNNGITYNFTRIK